MRFLFLLMMLGPLLQAEILFQDNFENGSVVTTDTKWITNTHGYVATDPLNPSNHALAFNGTQGAGDIFSSLITYTGTTYISFDYLSTGGLTGGGFIGIQGNRSGEIWLAGNCSGCFSGSNYTSALAGLTPGVWQHIVLTVPQYSGNTAYQLKLEQFIGTAPSAYFDNIMVATSTADLTSTPEPATFLLFGTVFCAWGILKPRRSERT